MCRTTMPMLLRSQKLSLSCYIFEEAHHLTTAQSKYFTRLQSSSSSFGGSLACTSSQDFCKGYRDPPHDRVQIIFHINIHRFNKDIHDRYIPSTLSELQSQYRTIVENSPTNGESTLTYPFVQRLPQRISSAKVCIG